MRTFGEPLVNLRSITYKDMVNASEKALWYLFKPIGMNMQHVDLRGCRRFKGRCFRLFGDALENILLDGCCRLDKQSLEELCMQSPNITELRLSACWMVSDDIVSLISRSLSHLNSFALCGDRFMDLSSAGLMAISRLKFLRELWLDYNSAVTDELLEALIESIPGLRLLSIPYAGTDSTITKEVVAKIANLKDLQTVTSKSVQELLNAFPIVDDSRTAKAVTVVIGGTICDLASLRLRNTRMVVDTSDYSAISSNTARGLLSSTSGFLGIIF
ncbi:unnamed protein product [Gongylonema pulchrum]|uniref:F-box/LRR-repeat protein 20 n=1 Tax=Gongylonema pulchrum TaxID=637853 RepID=A0A183EDR7_9BILA|nr:unnamed protein product [Gongylonema pulchrum]